MNNLFFNARLFISTIGMIALLLSPRASACEGNWTISVNQNAVEYKSNLFAYIPAYINLSREIRHCRSPHAYLSIKSNKFGVLKSSFGELEADIVDKNFRQLNYRPKLGFELVLDNSSRTQFWIKVKDARVAKAGTYVNTIDGRLSLNKPSGGTSAMLSEQVTTRSEEVKLRVPPFVSFNVANDKSPVIQASGDHYRMMLGVLRSGDRHRVNFSLLSNANILVNVHQQVGALKHSKQKSLKIPYLLYFDSKRVHKQLRYTIPAERSTSSRNIPMRLEIGNTDFARAGNYRDTIVIELKAKY